MYVFWIPDYSLFDLGLWEQIGKVNFKLGERPKILNIFLIEKSGKRWFYPS